MTYNIEPIKLVIFIVNRGDSIIINEICNVEGIFCHILLRGRGTADNAMLSLLGLGESEKDVVLLTVAQSRRDDIMQKISDRLKINEPGRGIGFSIPFSSVANQLNSYQALAGLSEDKTATVQDEVN